MSQICLLYSRYISFLKNQTAPPENLQAERENIHPEPAQRWSTHHWLWSPQASLLPPHPLENRTRLSRVWMQTTGPGRELSTQSGLDEGRHPLTAAVPGCARPSSVGEPGAHCGCWALFCPFRAQPAAPRPHFCPLILTSDSISRNVHFLITHCFPGATASDI